MSNLPHDGFMRKELLIKGQLVNASINDESEAHCSYTCPICGVRKCELKEGLSWI
jgi:hypothetical protein